MIYPYCKEDAGQIVYDSRSKGDEQIRHRRCFGCGRSFKTIETYDPNMGNPKFDGMVGKPKRMEGK